jgi:hypothetical protein
MDGDLPVWVDALAAWATIIAGVAAAYAAMQSRRAAEASREIAESTRTALLAVTKPDVQGGLLKRRREADGVLVWGGQARNLSPWPAVDVELELTAVDGTVHKGRADRLPGAAVLGDRTEPAAPLAVEIGEWADAGGTLVASVTVRFSDERRLGRWERRWAWVDGIPDLEHDVRVA